MSIALPPPPPRNRGIYCNRTLNLRAIRAIGYDMDYTLIHYHVEMWERRAYEYARDRLVQRGLPMGHLEFDHDLVVRGLIIDTHEGCVVKADRFGFIKNAAHGTKMLPFHDVRERYGRIFVDLRDDRWVFLSTLFDISLACLYCQAVDMLDAGELEQAPLQGAMGYRELFDVIRSSLDSAHIEGALKAEIIEHPEAFVDLDPDGPRALLDQRRAGKKLVLITNSEWHYSDAMMRFAYEPYLPTGMTWRDLFDLVVVASRKPSFFTDANPIYEVTSAEGHLLPLVGLPREGGTYHGGSATLVERALGLSGLDILYVGDHIFSDVNVSKSTVQWRTALVLRELEEEIEARDAAHEDEAELSRLMREKIEVERELALLRLDLQRRRAGAEPLLSGVGASEVEAILEGRRAVVMTLDQRIAPRADRAARLHSPRWGPVMRAGIDKSHLARQVERYADVYTSRVSNFLYATPNVYLRSPKSSLPHDL